MNERIIEAMSRREAERHNNGVAAALVIVMSYGMAFGMPIIDWFLGLLR